MEEKKQESKKQETEKMSESPAAPEENASSGGEGAANEAAEKIQPAEATSAESSEIDTAEDLRQQLEAQSDRYLRLMAEFDNFKKRVSRDYERLIESANEKLIGELIEVRENFERAIKAGEQTCTDKNFFEGIRLIFTKFESILAKQGLEPFGAAGEPFDPQLHDALMKIPHDSMCEDAIVEVFEKGYRLKNRVIKHAKVVVSSGPPEHADTKDANAADEDKE